MKQPLRRLDIVAMTRATDTAAHHAADTIARATRLQGDPDRARRLAAGLCRWCHYGGGRLGGAAMTSQPCSGCGEVQHYGSTATDVLCLPCANEHALCKRCGGDRETRTLRRKWPTLRPVVAPVEDGS